MGAAYAAQMKAVLAHCVPPGTVVDLAHDLRPHDVVEAAFVVRAMAERFPAGSVHVVVVDPGVGGPRAPVAVRCRDGTVLVGPDNGVLVPLCRSLGGGTAYRIERRRLGAGPRVGTTFDGRDVFAPAAGLIASGTSPRRLGPPTTLRDLPTRPPRRVPGGAVGSVAHVDRFGNLITDIPSGWRPADSAGVTVRCARLRRRLPWVTSYGEGGAARAVALGSSFGTVELAVGERRADERFGAGVGARVRLLWGRGPDRPARRNRK